MANIYNFGTNQLDLENYIKALRVNASTFLNEDPSTKKWTDKEKEEFKKVHEQFIKDVSENPERFYTDDFGTFYDKQGKWEENDSTKKYIYYADKMAKGLLRNSKKEKEKEEEKKEEFVPENFDAYFYRDNNVTTNDPAKELEHITDKREYLKGYIDTYITYLKDHGLSTEKFDVLKEVINNPNSTREQLINAFNKAQLDESFYTMFLPNQEDDKTIALKKLFEERSDTFNTAYPTIQNLYVGDAYDDLDDKDHDFITNDGTLNIGGNSIADLMRAEEIDFDKLSKEEALIQLKNKLLNNLLDKNNSSKYNSAVLLELLKMDKNVFETDEYIILDPRTKNLNFDYLNEITSNNAVLVYNKRNRKFELRYMDNFPQFKNQISENWEFDKGYKKPADYKGITDINKLFNDPYEKYDGIEDYVNNFFKENKTKKHNYIPTTSLILDLLNYNYSKIPGGNSVGSILGLTSAGLKTYDNATKDGFQLSDIPNLADIYFPRLPIKDVKKIIQDLVSKQKQIRSNKQGGTLNIQNVRKFQSGGTWRKNYVLGKNPKNINDWDNFYSDDIFDDFQIDVTSNEFLSGINELNSIDTSNLFKQKVLNQTGYKNWNSAYNKTGFNKIFGYSQDKDDYLGPTTWNRKTFLDQARIKYTQSNPLKTKDGSVYFDGTNWVKSDPNYSQKNYTLPYSIARKYGNITTTKEFDNKTRGLTTLEQKNGFNPTEGLLDVEQVDESKINPWEHQTNNGSKNNFNWNWLFDPKFTHAIPRAMYADHVNKKLRDMAIANEKAFLKSPFEYTRYVTGDLGSLIQGVKQANELNNWASKTYVSDADKQKAYQLEAFIKGLNYVAAGYNSDNAARKASEEQVWQQSQQNAQNRYITALENNQSLLKSDSNRNLYRMGYENQKHTNWDTLAKQFEFDAINNYKEKMALQRQSDLSSVSSYINNNIVELASKQGYNVSQDAVDLYNNVRKGNISESKLTPEEKESLNYVKDIVSNLRSIAIGKIYGYTPRYLSHYEYGPSYKFKEGGSIKERIANVERLYKTIKSDLDRNEKRLNRLFKGLYKLKNK